MSYEGWEIAEKVPPGKANSQYGEKSWFGSILCNDWFLDIREEWFVGNEGILNDTHNKFDIK